MNARDRVALKTLEGSMPETDPRSAWEDALDRMDRRRILLTWLVGISGGLPLIAVFAFGFFWLISVLPPDLHIGLRFCIGCGGGGAGCAMMRDILAAFPGFGWAKELQRISNAVEPFKQHELRQEAWERGE
jgi:hypothetical protein